jgi:D-apiose dehydrogenase
MPLTAVPLRAKFTATLTATPERPARVAIIGAGYFSQFHARGWAQMNNAQIVAICDPAREKAAALAKQCQLNEAVSVHDSVEQMLDQVKADIVDIVIPPDSHNAVVTAAIQRCQRVICQKPFGRDYAEAVALTDAAEEAGVSLVVHENFRFMPWYREAKRLVDTGSLGRLHQLSFRLRPGDGQGESAYLSRQPYFQKLLRFLIAETGIHFVDVSRFLFGEIVAVTARLRRINPHIAGEDAGVVLFEFANGALGNFDGNRCNEHVAEDLRRTMGEMWLETSTGVLRLDGDARLWWKPHAGKVHEQEREHVYERGDLTTFGGGACGLLQQHVLDSFVAGKKSENTARDYLTNLRIQEAIYESHEGKKRIEIQHFVPPRHALHPCF